MGGVVGSGGGLQLTRRPQPGVDSAHAELLAVGGVYAGLWAAGELEPAA